jgi:hypothetical protein
MKMKTTCLAVVALCWTMLAFAQPTNQNVSGGLIFEGEPFMAINPSNPQHIVVAWIGFVFQQPSGIKSRASFDGGQTWSTTAILPHFRPTYKSADPSLVFDTNGDVLACYVDYRQSPDSGGTFVVRSTNGGLTWGTTMHQVIDAYEDGLKLPVDRPWLTIDRSGGAFDGNLYVTTKPAPWVPAPNRPYFMRSTDGGNSWSNWQYLDATGFLVGNLIAAPMATPAVAADGNLHILYPSYVPSQNLLPGYLLASSSDGGATFQYNEAWFSLINGNDSLIKAGYQLLTDPSDANHIAFVTPQNLLGDQDIYYLESTDDGLNWAAPVRINDDATANGVTQDLVWGGFDNDGDLVLTWRDRRNASGAGYSVDSEIWGSVLWKDSTSFSSNFRVSDTLAAWNAILTQAGNDFMCSQMVDDTLFATWGDTRNGRLNIYFVKYDLRNLVPTGLYHLSNERWPEVQVFPNPAATHFFVKGTGILSIRLLDSQGKAIFQSKENNVDLHNLPAGSYLLEVNTESGIVNRRIVKQ